MGSLELLTYSALHRFAVEHYQSTGTVILLAHQLLAVSNADEANDSIGNLSKDSEEIVRLLITNLPLRINEAELRDVFQEFGQVYDFFWPQDKETGRKKGFAFADVTDSASELVIEALDGKEILGRQLVVNRVQPREDR